MKAKSSSSDNLAGIIAAAGDHPRRRWRRVVRVGIVALVALVLALMLLPKSAGQAVSYTTEPVRRGHIQLTITATGNLAPTNEVTVGSELSGTTLEVYVDTNDTVSKGQPLAKLDTSKLEQQTAAFRAAVRTADARIAEARASVKESLATLARQQELHRISDGRMPSQADLAAAEAGAARAEASLASAESSAEQARAQLSQNENDLRKAIIRSPIDGIVLKRAIEPGQTVAASFTAPELFVIAESLEQMKLEVSVAEADIGRVQAGQTARFTVDAWPNKTYIATVKKVSYGSTVSSNVVSYTTELTVSNEDLSLRPGMTATADIDVARSDGVLLVPAAALRFDPASLQAGQAPGGKSFLQSIMPMPPRMSRRPSDDGDAARTAAGQTGRLFVLRDGNAAPVEVILGLNDGRSVEVAGPGLDEGDAVILRVSAATP